MAKSKHSRLRVLMEKTPSPAEAANLIKAIGGREDKAIALSFGALLDFFLEKVIAATFQHQDSQLETDIFNNRGPLSDFESKILIADAFRIAPRIEFYIPLRHSIRRIRNAFAHSILDMDFDTKEVTDELETHLLPYI